MESDISKHCSPRKVIQFVVTLPKLMEHFFGLLVWSSQNGNYACSFKAAYTYCWIIVPKVLLTTLNLVGHYHVFWCGKFHPSSLTVAQNS